MNTQPPDCLPQRVRRLRGCARRLAGVVAPALALAAAIAPADARAQPAAAPADPPSYTEQLLDPHHSPLARPDGPRSLLPPARGPARDVTAGDVPPKDVFGGGMPGEDVPAGPETVFPGADAMPAAPAARLAPRPGEDGTAIAVTALSGLADRGIGLIGALEGGFPPDLWQGSRRLVVEDGLAALVAAPPSRAAADLYRRVLITRAPLPQGAGGGRSILGLRLNALYAGGFAGEALALARLVPMAELDAQMADIAARAALARGEVEAACGYLARLPASGESAAALLALELGALCQLRAGLDAAALLSVDLAREHPGFRASFEALALRAAGGPKLDLPGHEIFTSVDLALARAARLRLPETVLARAEPAILTALAGDAQLDWPLRVAAGEAAAVRGLMDGTALAALYRAAVVAGHGAQTPRVAAFAAVLEEADPAVRLAAVADAFAQTPAAMWPGLVPAFGNILRAVPPVGVHADEAPFMVEALALLGDAMRARAWAGVLDAAPDPETGRLHMLVRIVTPGGAGPGGPDWPGGMAEALARATERRLADGGAEAAWMVAAEAAVLEALGYPLPQLVQAQLADAGAAAAGLRPGEGSLRALEVAARAGRKGEAVLAVLRALIGPHGAAQMSDATHAQGAMGPVIPAALSPDGLGALVAALAAAGLEREARALAVEALVVRAHGGGAL